jgi:hypothetical protein
MGLSFPLLHTVGLEVRSDLLRLLDIAGTLVMRMWHAVHLGGKVLSPAAEAFCYFVSERGRSFM